MDKSALAKFLIKKERLSLEDLTEEMLKDANFLSLGLNYIESYNDIDFLYKTIYSDDAFELISYTLDDDYKKWFKILYDHLGKIVNKVSAKKLLYQNYGDLWHEFLVTNRVPFNVFEDLFNTKIPNIGYYGEIETWADLLSNRRDVHNVTEMDKYFNIYKQYPKSLETLVRSYIYSRYVNYEDIYNLKDLNIMSQSNLYHYIMSHNIDVSIKFKLLKHFNINITKEQFRNMFIDATPKTRKECKQKLSYLIK